MIASAQLASPVRAFPGIVPATAAGSEVSSQPSFHAVMGQVHSSEDDGQEESPVEHAPAKVGGKTPAVKSSAAQSQPKQSAGSAGSTNNADKSASSSQADPAATRKANPKAAVDDKPTASRPLYSSTSYSSTSARSQKSEASKQSTSTPADSAQAPVLTTLVAQPLRPVLPLTASLTLRQEGDATEDTAAEASDSTAAVDTDPNPLSAPAVETDEAANPQTGDLAFAARLSIDAAMQTASGQTASGQTASTQTTGDAAPAGTLRSQSAAQAAAQNGAASNSANASESDNPTTQAGSASDGGSNSHGNSENHSQQKFADAGVKFEGIAQSVPLVTASPSTDQTPAQSPASTSATNEAPASAHSQKIIDLPPQAATNSHDITVRIPDASDQGTAIRFLERGGEIHVSVRTGDAEMAQTLRGGLNDLANRFENGGIQAEIWQPGSNASFTQSGSQQPFANPDSSNGNSQSGSNSEQESDQRNKPRWVEELENSIGDINSKETPQLWQA